MYVGRFPLHGWRELHHLLFLLLPSQKWATRWTDRHAVITFFFLLNNQTLCLKSFPSTFRSESHRVCQWNASGAFGLGFSYGLCVCQSFRPKVTAAAHKWRTVVVALPGTCHVNSFWYEVFFVSFVNTKFKIHPFLAPPKPGLATAHCSFPVLLFS